jgi:hypothetical protein
MMSRFNLLRGYQVDIPSLLLFKATVPASCVASLLFECSIEVEVEDPRRRSPVAVVDLHLRWRHHCGVSNPMPIGETRGPSP